MSGQITCPKCGEQKNRDQFFNDKSRTSGVFPYCKTCQTDAVRRRAKDRAIPDMPLEEFISYIDRKAAPIEGKPGEFHWKWTGPVVNMQAGKKTPLARVFRLVMDRDLPPVVALQCGDEGLGFACINPDCVIPMGSMDLMSGDEMFDDFDGETDMPEWGTGFSIHDGQDEYGSFKSRAESLRELEEFPFEPGDFAADKFLQEHGYNRAGEPLKRSGGTA